MDLLRRLPSVTSPALVVTGARDISTPRRPHGDILLKHLPSATGAHLASAHLAPAEAPDALARAIVGFLPNQTTDEG